jgi:hypothetical protein
MQILILNISLFHKGMIMKVIHNANYSFFMCRYYMMQINKDLKWEKMKDKNIILKAKIADYDVSLIICAAAFAQPLLRSTKSAKKKKTRKKFLKYPLSETSKDICGSRRHWSCETKHCQNDNIAFARRFARRPRDGRATFARRPCDGSAKNRKINKKQKNSFFLNFLHVSNRTRVRNGV